jgi:hypothetical protein
MGTFKALKLVSKNAFFVSNATQHQTTSQAALVKDSRGFAEFDYILSFPARFWRAPFAEILEREII